MFQEATECIGSYLGLAGDALTFVGGLILAVDSALQARRFRNIRDRVKTYLSPELLQLRVEVDGVVITDKADIELPFIRHSAALAKLGSILLSLGFGCLLTARLFELPKVCH